MTEARRMSIGLSLRGAGYHQAGWRHVGAPSNPDTDIDYFVELARAAERSKLDFVFLADGVAIRQGIDGPGMARQCGLGGFEPLTLLSALAMATDRIGLLGTASTTYNEPYQIARAFASLDHVSKGRACWNLVASWSDDEAKNFGRERSLDNTARYDRAREFVKVVLGLWDGWEEDVFVRDKQAGIYLRPEKIHALNHKGSHFSVRGPLNVPRTPQGRPLICQAGASDVGQEIAAETADMIFCVAANLSAAQAYYRSVKGKMARYGRDPASVKVLPGTTMFVGRTEKEAQEKHEYMKSLLTPELGLSILNMYFGDLSKYDIDGPLPEQEDPADISIAKKIRAMAKDRGLTIRQVYTLMANGQERNFMVGSAEQVADNLETWFRNEAADGFNLTFPNLPGGFDDFAELVLPILQERGLFRRDYDGTMLREHLGVTV